MITYGGDAGMVLTPQPIFSCIEHLTSQRKYDELIFTAADGKVFDQGDANELSLKTNLIILCGHYKGVDQRVRDALITKEYSIGDVVLSGGELPAMVITDAIVRLLQELLAMQKVHSKIPFKTECWKHLCIHGQPVLKEWMYRRYYAREISKN